MRRDGQNGPSCGPVYKDDGQAQDIFSRCRVKGFAFDVEVLYLARRLGYQARGCRLPGLPSPKAESIRSRTPCGCCWMLHSFACRLVGACNRSDP